VEAKEPPSTGTNAPHPLFLFSRFVRLFIFFGSFTFVFYTTGSKLAKRAGSKKIDFPGLLSVIPN